MTNVLETVAEVLALDAQATAGPFHYADGVMWAGVGDDLENSGDTWLSCCNTDDATMQLIARYRTLTPELARALATLLETIHRAIAEINLQSGSDYAIGAPGMLILVDALRALGVPSEVGS